MHQRKKLILLAALIAGFQFNTQADAVTKVDVAVPSGLANIGATINVTISTTMLNAATSGDLACATLGTSSTALVTSKGLNPLNGFTSAAQYWANETKSDPALATTTLGTWTTATGTSIAGVTGETNVPDVSAMTRDIVVGCLSGDGLVWGDATAGKITWNDTDTGTFVISFTGAADWGEEPTAVNAYASYRSPGVLPVNANSVSNPITSSSPFNADWLRPPGVIGVESVAASPANLLAHGGSANMTSAQIKSGGQTVLNFTGGSLTTAGIGSVISLNVTMTNTVAVLSPIFLTTEATKHTIKADLGTGSAITVFDKDVSAASLRTGNDFSFLYTVPAAAAGKGTVLDKALSATGQIATFYTEDAFQNKGSVAQDDLTWNPASSYMDFVIVDESYQLVAADVNGLVAGNKVSRGATNDTGGMKFTPAATDAKVPTLFNLTLDISSGGKTASVVYNNPTRNHLHAALGQDQTGISVNFTRLNATPPVIGGFADATTGTIADGEWILSFGGQDAAGNPLLPYPASGTLNVSADITAPTLVNFSPRAVGDAKTALEELTAIGSNSETLATGSTLTLNCSAYSTASGLSAPKAYTWDSGTAVQEIEAKVSAGGAVVPKDGATCSWAWVGTDLHGTRGTDHSGVLSAYCPTCTASTPSSLAIVSATTTQTAGATYDVQVQVRDADGNPVFGISSAAETTDWVNISSAFTAGDGACAMGLVGASTCNITFSGTGVTDHGNGTATLALGNFAANGSLNATVTNYGVGANVFSGVLTQPSNTNIVGSVNGTSSAIATTVAAANSLRLSNGGAVTAGAIYDITVDVIDKWGNIRTADAGFAEISTNIAGAEIPGTAIKVAKGTATFSASADYVGAQTIWAREVSGLKDGAGVALEGSLAHTIAAIPALTGVGGSDVPNDNGNFIYLNMSGVAPEAQLVRIWRDVSGIDDPVSYATFTPPAGGGDVTVIVYTPDNTATSYSVSQETANSGSDGAAATANGKQAFASTEGIDSYYELMAETMMKSKQSVSAPDAPVFATLTPDAISMMDGVAPSFKLGDNGLESSGFVSTEPIRAIDNIAPAPVQQLRALDTPADAGGSITVTWQKSVDDRMLTQNTAQAIGTSSASLVAGVHGYNVYRKVGAGEFDMVGSVAAGETSFEDKSVFNALRYTYAVGPFDADNVGAVELERTSMAIRNNVKDSSGNLVMGLFGADNSVGFDDFFIFADVFGQTATSVAFDPAFDLHPNNRIDLDDFFVFADYFGRGVESVGRVVPMLAGLNGEASLTLDSGEGLPRVGEEMTIAVNLEDYIELRGYGFNLSYDSEVMEFVGSRVEDNLLGEGSLAQPQVIPGQDGKASIIAFGDETVVDGDLGLNLVFRTKQEIESSYVEITDGQLRDGSYGVNDLRGPVSVMIETRPEVYALHDNYPNPFNPETVIKYQLPEAGFVTLEVYNMLGQVVRTLVSDHQSVGRYAVRWDAANDKGQALSSGMYFYHVRAGQEFQQTKKMLLLK